MSEQIYNCPKCSDRMSRGFVSDYSENSHFVANWVEGEPVNREIFGIKGINVEVHGRRQFGVRSLRCEKCGYLELYAV